MRGAAWRAIGTDLTRLGIGASNAWRSARELGPHVDWVYERFATLQCLGRVFQVRGIPWVLETNGPFYYEARVERGSLVLAGLARRLELDAYRRCDVLVSVSDVLRDLLIREAGLRPDKIVVMRNAVDINRFRPARPVEGLQTPNLTVGFVGTLLPWQGLDLLLRSVAALRRELVPIDVRIVGDGSARPDLEQLASRLGIRDCVRFDGHVAWQDVSQRVASFDLGYSGQTAMRIGGMYHSPLKLYEYMAAAKPVLASAFEDARALVESKGTGYLFRPGDVENLTSVLRQAYTERDRLVAMGASARREVEAHHTWNARIRELLPQIAQVLQRVNDAAT